MQQQFLKGRLMYHIMPILGGLFLLQSLGVINYPENYLDLQNATYFALCATAPSLRPKPVVMLGLSHVEKGTISCHGPRRPVSDVPLPQVMFLLYYRTVKRLFHTHTDNCVRAVRCPPNMDLKIRMN